MQVKIRHIFGFWQQNQNARVSSERQQKCNSNIKMTIKMKTIQIQIQMTVRMRLNRNLLKKIPIVSFNVINVDNWNMVYKKSKNIYKMYTNVLPKSMVNVCHIHVSIVGLSLLKRRYANIIVTKCPFFSCDILIGHFFSEFVKSCVYQFD